VAVAIAELAKAPHRWKNFQVKAFYRPEIVGRSAELKREGVVQFNKGLSTGAQFSLRGIFSKAFSKNASWELMPERIVQEPKLGYAAVTQFEIVDGWLGISLGPKREASRPAARWR
jgi:hypothetical protein